MTQRKVVIVGAGPTGLTAAIELARRGIIATVVDKKDTASTLSRAVGISPSTLEMLEASGLHQQFIEEGIQVQQSRLYFNGRSKLTLDFNGIAPPYNFLLCLPQDKSESILMKAFVSLGGQIFYSHEVVDVNQTDQGIQLNYANGQTEQADIVIAADGVHSKIRRSLKIDYPGYELDEQWSIADVDLLNWPHSDSIVLYRNPQAEVFLIVPIGPNRYRMVSNTEDALGQFPQPVQVQAIHRQGTFAISVRQATSYQQGNIFLVGDAAHCHSPVGGKGMNLGMADAAELAKLIAENNTDAYTSNRHPKAKQVITQTEAMRKIMTNPKRALLLKMLLLFVSTLTRIGFIKNKLLNRMLSID